MTDFHSHILPKTDDGSHSVQESEAMLTALSEQGIKRVVATPHFYANDESVERFLHRRKEAYKNLEPVLTQDMPEVVQGAEVRYYEGISRLKELKLLCVEQTPLLLLEMQERRWTEYTLRELEDIASDGRIKLVLAHVERYLKMQRTDAFYRLLQNGIMMQINADFVNGFFSRRKALDMLKNNAVHFLGSDCHNMTDRRPEIGKAYKTIENKLGRDFLAGFNNFTEEIFDEIHILKG